MTQQTQGDAVGGASDTVVAAEPTLEDRFAAIAGDEQADDPNKRKPEEEGAEAPEGAQAETPELTVEDVAEAEAEAPEEGDRPIPPPASWTAEEKAEFAELPPAQQKIIARREAEREKFVQTKAQEAAQTRSNVEKEALAYAQQLQEGHIQALQGLMVQVPPEPGPHLQIEDPYTYADQLQAHRDALAHNAYIEQHVTQAAQRAAQAQQLALHQEAQQTQSTLAEKFPEYLDAEKGPKLRQELGSIAAELGFSADQLQHVDATDILAFKRVSEWKGKALKYDTLMAKKMQTVRDAKNLPQVSRPGAAQPRGAAANASYTADRQAMRAGDRDAGVRVFSNFIK